MPEPVDLAGGDAVRRPPRQPRVGAAHRADGDVDDVGGDTAVEHQSLRLAVGGDEAHPAACRSRRGGGLGPAVGIAHGPRRCASVAEEGAEQQTDARAVEPGEADDLAGTGGERHVHEPASDRQPVDDQPGIGAVGVGRVAARRVELVLLRADHRLDDLRHGQVTRRPGQHLAAVAHHRHPIGDLEHLLEAVRHVQDRDALGGEVAEDGEQPARLAIVQRRVRLVEDQHPGPLEQRPRQLDELALADRHPTHGEIGVDVEAEPLEHRLGELLHPPPRHESEPRRLVVDEEVGEHRALGQDAELLVHDADAVGTGGPRRGELDDLAVQRDRAAVRSDRARQHLHQGRLAGPVLADDRVDAAGGDLEVHAVDRDDAAVRLAQLLDLDRGHATTPAGVGAAGDRRAHPSIMPDSASIGSIEACQSAMTPSTSGW